jgi:O-antigen ligase
MGSFTFLLLPFPEFSQWRFFLMALTILSGAITILPIQPYNIRVTPLDLILGIFILLQFLSAFWAMHPSLVWRKAMYWLLLLLLYLLARNVKLKEFDLHWCAIVFVLLNVLNYLFLIGVYYQFVAAKGAGGRLAHSDIDQLMRYFTTNGNYIGSLMVILFPFYFKLLEKEVFNRFFLYALMIVHTVLLFSFNSKAVLIALCLSTIYILWPKKDKAFSRKGLVVFAIALVVSLATIFLMVEKPAHFLYTLGPGQTITGKTSDERVAIWQQSVQLYADNPLLGVGAGNWPIEFFKYGVSHFRHSFDSFSFYLHAHNLFLEILGELGSLGGVFLLFIFIYPFWLLYKFSGDKTLQNIIPYLICYLIVSSFYGVAYGSLDNFHPAQFLWVFVLGLIPSSLQPSFGEFSSHKLPEKFLVWTGTVCLLWAIFVLKKETSLNKSRKFVQEQRYDLALSNYLDIYHPRLFRYYNGSPLMTKIGLLHWNLGERELAVQSLNQSVSDSPYNPVGWIHLANMSNAMGDISTAKIAYQTVSSLNNTYFPAQIALAQIALREKDWEAFDKNLAFYEKEILPRKEKNYSELVWKSENEVMKNHWRKMCGYEDVVIELREKRRTLTKED